MNSRNLLLIAFLVLFALQSIAQNAKKYTTYVVKEGETMKSIAKKIGCKTKEIRNLNPDVDKKNPRVNTTLVVPNKNYGNPIIKAQPQKPVEKVIIHTVEPGHTFYGIAKEYNVTIQSIKDANPLLADGLNPGQKIRIPSKSEYTIQPETGKVVFYKIRKGDTKWRIATLHDISVAELERINPNLNGELKENDNIWVPAPQEIPEEVKDTYKQKQDPPHIYHVVKQGEGLFRIAVLYDTTQQEIIDMNPEATKKLRPGMLLKIPGKKKANFLTHKVVKGDTYYNLRHRYGISKEELFSLNPELEEGLKTGMLIRVKPLTNQISESDIFPNTESDNTYLIDSISMIKNIHISFLMPLKTEKKVDYTSKNDSQLRTICTDFFMGAEIAIDSLKKLGLNVTHHVYDTKNDLSQIYRILKDKDLKKSDVIIGPLFFENTQKVAREFPDIPVIAPIYSKKQTTDYTKNLIKSVVDKNKMTTVFTKYLISKYKQEKIIIVTDTKKDNIAQGKKISMLLKQHDSISNITIIEPTHNKKRPKEIYMNKTKLENSVDKKKGTWVLLISDDNIVTSDIVNTYGVMANDHSIRLFTSKMFKTFNHLNYQYLGQLSWSFPASNFDQLNTKAVENFKKDFYQLNYSYPSSDAFTGFDLTYDILIRLAASDEYPEGLELGKSNRLSHQYDYDNMGKGYYNKGVLMVTLNKDLEYKLLK